MGKNSTLMQAHRKRQKAAEKERQGKADLHNEKYEKLVETSGKCLDARLDISDRGISAYLIVAEVKTGKQVKGKEEENFKKEYGEIKKEVGIEFFAEIAPTMRGLTPRIRLRECAPVQITSWEEAQRQNLETRKECTHELNKKHGNCKMCGLPKDDWGKDGKGATEAYVKLKEEQLRDAAKAKEEKK